jgi:hypothetical protein
MTTATSFSPVLVVGEAPSHVLEEGATSSSTDKPITLLGEAENQPVATPILILGAVEEEICRICRQALQVEGMPDNEIDVKAQAHVRCLQPPVQMMQPVIAAQPIKGSFPWKEVLKTTLSGLVSCFFCCKS